MVTPDPRGYWLHAHTHTQDLANLRLSLPANLLEPQGNLEWWHYLDRPDRRLPPTWSELVLTPDADNEAVPYRLGVVRSVRCHRREGH